MGNIGKRTTVHQCRCMFQCLDQIRLQGILQESRHGSHCLQIGSRHRLSLVVISNNDPAQPLFQILKIRGKTKNRHDLRSHRDHEMILTDKTVRLGSETYYDISERTVIHVKTTFPDYLPGINAQLVPLLYMIVKKRRQEIVG